MRGRMGETIIPKDALRLRGRTLLLLGIGARLRPGRRTRCAARTLFAGDPPFKLLPVAVPKEFPAVTRGSRGHVLLVGVATSW